MLELAEERERLAAERLRRCVVAAEQPFLGPGGARLSEHGLDRGRVPVDVVEDGNERHNGGA